MKVKYVSTSKFTNDFINSIGDRDRAVSRLPSQYRTNDFLLVDDIQFLAQRGTQEEFFHTFNTLQQAEADRVVLMSTKDIGSQEDREKPVRDGLITDILRLT